MKETVYTLDEIRNLIKQKDKDLKEKYNISRFLIFGSYARGEQTSESDIDILVELTEPIGLLKLVELSEMLETILQKKVDLGTIRGLKPYLKDKILGEAISL